MKKQYRDFLFYCLFVCFFCFRCFYANLLKFLCFCSIKDTLKICFCYCGDTFLTLFKKKRLVMHACARSAKQKYGYIYIYFLMKTFLKTGVCIYIYLVFTKSVDSNFRAFWLAPVTRNILGYSLFCERKEKWRVVSRKFQKKKLKQHFFIHLIW